MVVTPLTIRQALVEHLKLLAAIYMDALLNPNIISPRLQRTQKCYLNQRKTRLICAIQCSSYGMGFDVCEGNSKEHKYKGKRMKRPRHQELYKVSA